MSHADPYADYPPAQGASAPQNGDGHDAPRGRSRSRSPPRNGSGGGGGYRSPGGGRSPGYRRRSPPPRKPHHAPAVGAPVPQNSSANVTKPARPQNPNPTHVLGVFGLSIRTQERDLEEEFGRFGRVEKVTIVYDQRTDRSRGFGFITMASVEDATRCIQELNGIDLNGRRIRVDYSVTERPHAPTPGEYMGLRRSSYREGPRERYNDRRHDDRDRERYRGDRYDRYNDYDRYDRDRRDERYREDYRDRDWRDRRSPPPRGGSSRYSPKRRSYSRSPPRGGGGGGGGQGISPRPSGYDASNPEPSAPRW